MKQNQGNNNNEVWLHNKPLEFYFMSDTFEFERMIVSPDFKYIIVIVEHSVYDTEELKSDESDQDYKLIILSTETHKCIHRDYCESIDFIEDYHYFSSDSRYFIYPKNKQTKIFDLKTRKIQNFDVDFKNIYKIHGQNIFYKNENRFIIEDLVQKTLQFYPLLTQTRGIIIQPSFYVCREEMLKLFDYRYKCIGQWDNQQFEEETFIPHHSNKLLVSKTMEADQHKTKLWLLPKGKLIRKVSNTQNVSYSKEGKEEKVYHISDKHIFNIIRGTDRPMKLQVSVSSSEEHEKITSKLYVQLDKDHNLKYTTLEKII